MDDTSDSDLDSTVDGIGDVVVKSTTPTGRQTRSMGKKVPNSKRNQPASSSACVVFIIAIARPI